MAEMDLLCSDDLVARLGGICDFEARRAAAPASSMLPLGLLHADH